jgi:tRNA A-37 threonylcarbamoyl transferase component Bud32
MNRLPIPPGYTRIDASGVVAVAQASHADAVRKALEWGTLHDWARLHPATRPLAGRAVAYAAPLPLSDVRVVVRHNRHGGLLAGLTGDRFLAPTRAPLELATAIRLHQAGIPTPEVVAYAVYDAGGLFRRSDVMTLEVANAVDLATLLEDATDGERRTALAATAGLVSRLGAAGARHHDLNIKNILLRRCDDGAMCAYVLDVDRVVFGRAGDAGLLEGNLKRLERSARKWREQKGLQLGEVELRAVREMASTQL